MQLTLVKNAEDLVGSYYAAFYPGERGAPLRPNDTVYMDGDAFEALCFVAGNFRVTSTTTLAGFAIDRLVEELEEASRRISHSDSPKQVWPLTSSYGYTQFLSIDDWEVGRQQFCTMLQELGSWLRAARERDEPVTIRGV